MKIELKLILSFLLGICGIVLLFCNFFVVMFLPVAHPSNLGELISQKIRYTLGSPAHFFFLLIIPFSLIGIFLGIKSTSKQLGILAILLNAVNLLLSLIIAWLLFGLARGM